MIGRKKLTRTSKTVHKKAERDCHTEKNDNIDENYNTNNDNRRIKMIGAIFGDIVGSVYEWHNIKTTEFPLMKGRSTFTDDSVMTVAVGKALINTLGQDDETIKAELVKQMQAFGREYEHRGYGGRFISWIYEEEPRPYNSFGNGSAMRVSAAGWLYESLEETLHMAELSAAVTHNHPEGIKGAKSTAAAIFMARKGSTKAEIKNYIKENFAYDLDRTLDEIRPGYNFDVTCQGSVPESIIAFLEGDSFEKVIRLAISLGGDSDTIACIAGSIAEAYYGIPEDLKKMAEDRIPEEFKSVIRQVMELRN